MTIASVDQTIRLISTGAAAGTTCSPDLATAPWEFDSGVPGYGPGSSMGDVIPTGSPRQGELPERYRTASADELAVRIRAARVALGDRVVILGHFYQRDEVLQYADYIRWPSRLCSPVFAVHHRGARRRLRWSRHVGVRAGT